MGLAEPHCLSSKVAVSPDEVEDLQRLRSQFVTLKPGRGQYRKCMALIKNISNEISACAALSGPANLAGKLFFLRGRTENV